MTTLATATEKTPNVEIDGSGAVKISGKSYPEDLHAFWDPIVAELEGRIASKALNKIIFDLTYHNSGTTRIFVNLIKFIEAKDAIDGFEVVWRFDEEDEQTEEQGEDYEMLCNKIRFTAESY